MAKSTLTPAERRELDNLRAEAAKNKAHTDYLAMMCDIEIPEPENDENAEGGENV